MIINYYLIVIAIYTYPMMEMSLFNKSYFLIVSGYA